MSKKCNLPFTNFAKLFDSMRRGNKTCTGSYASATRLVMNVFLVLTILNLIWITQHELLYRFTWHSVVVYLISFISVRHQICLRYLYDKRNCNDISYQHVILWAINRLWSLWKGIVSRFNLLKFWGGIHGGILFSRVRCNNKFTIFLSKNHVICIIF